MFWHNFIFKIGSLYVLEYIFTTEQHTMFMQAIFIVHVQEIP